MALVPYVPSIIKFSLYLRFNLFKYNIESGRQRNRAGTWLAGQVLANFLAENEGRSQDFWGTGAESSERWTVEDKVVWEVGAGMGLVSIVAGMLGACIHATDGEETLLPYLEENLQAHSSTMKYQPTSSLLKWGDSSCLEFQEKADIIVAADVVFGEDTSVW
eukprot:CAMPEP_0117801176 /NCGR_PEP_ID=MMETSP0948-20121206/14918_1 /TAXON_ID=44440 /ORGANISM="Chattonella subsalsa, Strain CCMP2191" /LENGTH=161 /DNA_ID=CAMNT_0005633613 /DNA_START=48 /DNA_END=531 /DNA_ORIENTATION=-